MLPFKKGTNPQPKTKPTTREVDVDLSLVDQTERARRQTTVADNTARSAEKQKGKQVRGVAEVSKKRKTLDAEMEAAVIPMDNIFGTTPTKPWSEHPRFHEFISKAGTYVEKLGFSSPSAGGPSETMHTLARKLDVQLAAKKQPSKKILIEAIVIRKLNQLDPTQTTYK